MDQRRSRLQPLPIALVLFGALLRLVPHPSNFTPIGGMALFGGSKLRSWQAFAIPLLAMLVTDPILSHRAGYPAYSWATLVIYGCLALNVALGRWFLKQRSGALRVGAVALLGSIQFFVITNFFTWLRDGIYPATFAGLTACYVAALPFFGYSILGDLFYSAVLFGAHSLAAHSEESRANSALGA